VVSVDLVEQVRKVIQPVWEGTTVELVEIRFVVERGRRILRLYIDKPGGVTLQDCSAVSKEVSHLMDVHNLIRHRYTLEVSSPGLDRPLREPSDFRRNLGRLVQVTTLKSSGSKRTIVGNLSSWREKGITLEVGGKGVFIPENEIVKTKLKPKF
jgi:ribosome maturation factor RimP